MLTDRQLLILQVLIDEFIDSAKPVGSRSIAKYESVPYSAATIRNDMADLEDFGLIEKTHTSSGRVPSELGYRYYVDHVIAPSISKNDIHLAEDIIHGDFFEFEEIVQKSAELLSELTSYTSIILGPEVFQAKLQQLQFVKLSSATAVAILITNTGHVEHRSFVIPEEVDPADLEKMVNILNERLHGVSIFKLPELLQTEVYSMMQQYLDEAEKSYQYLKAAFLNEQPVKLYFGGKSNMLLQPEFNDVEKLRSFYQMMDNTGELANLLMNSKNGLKVKIGHENELDAIKDFSMITTTYHLGNEQMGTIALFGPTRMEYRKVISLLKTVSFEMTDALYLWYKNNG